MYQGEVEGMKPMFYYLKARYNDERQKEIDDMCQNHLSLLLLQTGRYCE